MYNLSVVSVLCNLANGCTKLYCKKRKKVIIQTKTQKLRRRARHKRFSIASTNAR